MNTATNVHHNLQGAVIPSSGSVGMRIQYPFLHQNFLFDASYRTILPILLVLVNWKLSLPGNASVKSERFIKFNG